MTHLPCNLLIVLSNNSYTLSSYHLYYTVCPSTFYAETHTCIKNEDGSYNRVFGENCVFLFYVCFIYQ